MSRHPTSFKTTSGRVALFSGAFVCLGLAGAVDSRLSLIVAWVIVGYAAISLVVALARK